MNMTASQPTFGLWYDFRNPEQWSRPFEGLYRELLDQISWAESLGIGSVWLSEHHFVPDGYTPSPLVIAAAIAERTQTMRLGTNILVAPLHNPVRLAEDAATLAILSQGRFNLGVGQGYWKQEYEAFGRNIGYRPSLLEESVALIRRAWSGSSQAFTGKRFAFPDIPITPVPPTPPLVLVGAMFPPGIERAARIGDGFLSAKDAHTVTYLEALERLGRPAADGIVFQGSWAIIADDPERVWSEIGQHALYQQNAYISWGGWGPPETTPRHSNPDELVSPEGFQLWDGNTAVRELTTLLRNRPQVKDIHFWAQLPGESLQSGAQRIEFLAKNVIPRVRKELEKESS
jgi:alkanesulfonate monooxygenase SsuD/methylene tetrahydromethanopterin reductase-like flavin-dependent oxidoreductase (luciferase family)